MNKDESIKVEKGLHQGHTATVVGFIKTASAAVPVAKVTCSCGDVLQFPDDGETDLAEAMASITGKP